MNGWWRGCHPIEARIRRERDDDKRDNSKIITAAHGATFGALLRLLYFLVAVLAIAVDRGSVTGLVFVVVAAQAPG